MKAKRNALKAFIPMVMSFLPHLFGAAVKYKKEKLMTIIKDNEHDIRLVLFEKNDVIYCTMTAFDSNGSITRQIPFDAEGQKIAVPVQELIEKLLKAI